MIHPEKGNGRKYMMAESVHRNRHLIANARDVPDLKGVILAKHQFLNKNRNLPCIAASNRAVTGTGTEGRCRSNFTNFKKVYKLFQIKLAKTAKACYSE